MHEHELLPTAAVTDACLRENIACRLGPPSVQPLIPGAMVAGPVRTALHVGSVDVFFEAMTRANRGDVLVIDDRGRDDEGCIGDLTVIEAVHFGLAAVLVWGRHRDTAELRRIGLPVFSRGAFSPGPKKMDKTADSIVRFGDVVVSDADYCFADDDGVVFIPAAERSRVIAAASAIVRGEREQAEKVRGGTSLHAQFKWDDYVARRASDPTYDFRQHLKTLGGEIEV